MVHYAWSLGPDGKPLCTFIGSQVDVGDIDGPAVLIEGDRGSPGLTSGIPVAACEPGEDWEPVQSYVSEAWVKLPARTRQRLVDDPDAELSEADLSELVKAGGLVAQAFWPGHQSDPGMRVRQGFREFVTLLSSLNGE